MRPNKHAFASLHFFRKFIIEAEASKVRSGVLANRFWYSRTEYHGSYL
jgi:hypothetical protein